MMGAIKSTLYLKKNVIEYVPRENMKLFKPFLLSVILLLPHVAMAQVATTAGSNLTAWNGNSGATNNNNWNQLTNSRVQATAGAPKADFGNCNSLIMRCAQPKCMGCTTIDIARPIVTGCVNSNTTCKQYGSDLIESISAQLVANANAKAQQAAAAQAAAAQQAAAEQSNAQIQQMQQQMANMQQQMQQQSAQQMAQMQAALDEQKALVAAAQAEASAAKQENYAITSSVELTQAEQARASTGEVSAEVMARERIQGQILSEIENAEDAMKNLKSTMQNIFSYAGCDSRGNNCSGPRRVSIFKEKAMKFFDPFDTVAESMYEALEKALAVGVDVTDVIMMLSGACNRWAKYMCTGSQVDDKGRVVHKPETYNLKTNCPNGRSKKGGRIRGGHDCTDGSMVPPEDDTQCTFVSYLDSTEDAQREWILAAEDDDKLIRLGCPTASLDALTLLGRNRSKKNKALDLDTLEKLINQDSLRYAMNNKWSAQENSEAAALKYCALSPKGYEDLVAASQSKKLPKKVCIASDDLLKNLYAEGVIDFIRQEDRPDYSKISKYNKEDCEKQELKKGDTVYCSGVWQNTKSGDEGSSECDGENEDNCCECVVQGPCVWDRGQLFPKEYWEEQNGNSGGGKTEVKTTTGLCRDHTTEFTCNQKDGCKWSSGICILDTKTVTISAPKLDFSKGLGAAKKLLTQ